MSKFYITGKILIFPLALSVLFCGCESDSESSVSSENSAVDTVPAVTTKSGRTDDDESASEAPTAVVTLEPIEKIETHTKISFPEITRIDVRDLIDSGSAVPWNSERAPIPED